jgi:hypothetical protein
MVSDRHTRKTDLGGRNPTLAAAFIVYGTLFLLLATMPGGVVSWLQGLNSNAVQQRALRAAELVQMASDRIGLSVPYRRAREAFLKETEDQ